MVTPVCVLHCQSLLSTDKYVYKVNAALASECLVATSLSGYNQVHMRMHCTAQMNMVRTVYR